MMSASRKSSSDRARPFPAISEVSSGDGADKRVRILDAALGLFLRYGVKRTSVDDVAREAAIAKGTVYLYFDSKDALFAAIAERICDDLLGRARRTIASPAPLAERLVGLLDAHIGILHRLVAQSPHVAELTESKKAFAATAFAAFDREMTALLRGTLNEGGIVREDAPEMFLAAGFGVIGTGDAAEDTRRLRLTALVETLLAGLAQRGG